MRHLDRLAFECNPNAEDLNGPRTSFGLILGNRKYYIRAGQLCCGRDRPDPWPGMKDQGFARAPNAEMAHMLALGVEQYHQRTTGYAKEFARKVRQRVQWIKPST